MRPYLMIDSDEAKLKTYKSSTVGTKSILRLEFEVSDHLNLGHILRQCANFQIEQKAASEASKPRKRKDKLRSFPSPLLQLPYHGSEE